MPNQYHPRLREDGTMTPRDGEETPTPTEEVQKPLEGATPPTPSAEDIAARAVGERYITLDRQNLYQELRRVAESDAEFNNRIKEYAGRSIKRSTEQRIVELESELGRYRAEANRARIAQMDPAEFEQRLATDREFAQIYLEALHPDNDEDQTMDRKWGMFIENTTDDVLDSAAEVGIPTQRIDEFRRAWTYCPLHRTEDHGYFDHDERGRYFDELYPDQNSSLTASLEYFRRVVQADVITVVNSRRGAPPQAPSGEAPTDTPVAAQQPPASPPAQPPATPTAPAQRRVEIVGQGNPNLSARTPDNGRGVRGPATGVAVHSDEIRSWEPDKRIKFFEEYGGRKAAIESGIVYVPGLSEELGFSAPR